MTPRVLIIDDDERLAAMLRSYLEPRGYAVLHRPDLAGGLAQVRLGKPDAVILDVMLPDGDGLAGLRQIRAGSDVPVIMLTARGDDTESRALELGAQDYLRKPVRPTALSARVKAVLKRARA